MTCRSPYIEPLIPDDLRDRLIENGRAAEVQDGFDPFAVVQLFTPDGPFKWLLSEAYPDGSDLRLFGLLDFGVGAPVLGFIVLSDLERLGGRLCVPVERDRDFEARHPISTYVNFARRAGVIFT